MDFPEDIEKGIEKGMAKIKSLQRNNTDLKIDMIMKHNQATRIYLSKTRKKTWETKKNKPIVLLHDKKC